MAVPDACSTALKLQVPFFLILVEEMEFYNLALAVDFDRVHRHLYLVVN